MRVIRTPRYVDVEITAACNQRCSYCYFFDNPEVPYHDLPLGEWLSFFEELGRCGVMRVTLQGGEPFMRGDLREVISGVVENRMRFAVLSNGTLIDDSMAAFIARTNRCDQVQVSVDGPCARIHDATRGRGSFDAAIAGLKRLQSHSIPVGVRVTISRHNVGHLEETARFLLEDLGLARFGTNSAGYIGTCRRHADELLLDPALHAEAMQALVRIAGRYPGRVLANAGPLADALTWRKMLDAAGCGAGTFDDGGRLTGCGCHFTTCAVRADGVIIPCVLLAHMEMGRINKDSLEAVWNNSPVLAELRSRSSIELKDFEYCRACLYSPYCTGNCPAMAYTQSRRVNAPSPDGCLRRFLDSGGRPEDIP